MISNIEDSGQGKTEGRLVEPTGPVNMHQELLALFVETRFAVITSKIDDVKRDGELKDYLLHHIVGTMLMIMQDIPEIRALTISKETMWEAKKKVVFWLNKETFKEFYQHFDKLYESKLPSEFAHNYESAVMALRAYFTTHTAFAGMCLGAKSAQTLEDHFEAYFIREFKRTKCTCEECTQIKQHFKIE